MIEEGNTLLSSKKVALIIFILVTFLSLLKKGAHDVQEWDESRNGVNAYEMLQNGDYLNLYYNGQPDTWNAKPPLLIWCITASYKIFGFNEFALRFPSTICTIIFFLLCFFTIKLLESTRTAFFTCLVLLSCKAVLGHHIGLTGDFDAMLLLFLTASVYSFILYTEKQNKLAIFLTALFTGLAFYTKGPASLVLIPGFLLYIFISKKMYVFKDLRLWLAAFTFIIIAGSWIYIGSKYGKTTEHSVYGSKNPIETMLIHDTYQRLTNPKFGTTVAYESNYLFFFEVIDARLNLWNYLLYPIILICLYFLYKNKKNIITYVNKTENKMTLLSVCLIMPLSLILTFASTKHNWYLAPIFMYVSFIIVKGIIFISERWKKLYVVFGCLFLFAFLRHIYYIYSLPTETHDFFANNNKRIKNRNISMDVEPKQVILLYLKWLNVNFIPKEKVSSRLDHIDSLLILTDKNHSIKSDRYKVRPLFKIDDYSLDEIQKLNP